jgi:hypothetical protein
LTKTSFRECGKALSIIDDSFIISQNLRFENCNIGIECFPSSSLVLTKFSSQNSPFSLKPFSALSASKGTTTELKLDCHSNSESNDLFATSIFHSVFSAFVNQKCHIPAHCIRCQSRTSLSYFSFCKHSLYCNSCFNSAILHDRKYSINYSHVSCELCGTISYYSKVTLFSDSLPDSDCFCLCCHSHSYRQLCRRCKELGCNRCFHYYRRNSSTCLCCSRIDCNPFHFNSHQIFSEIQTLSYEL